MRIPIRLANHEDSGQDSRAIFQLLALVGFRVEVVLENRCSIVERTVVVTLFVCLHRKKTQVLAYHVQARDSPCFEAQVLVPPEYDIQ